VNWAERSELQRMQEPRSRFGACHVKFKNPYPTKAWTEKQRAKACNWAQRQLDTELGQELLAEHFGVKLDYKALRQMEKDAWDKLYALDKERAALVLVRATLPDAKVGMLCLRAHGSQRR
jgi:hypothetical protein